MMLARILLSSALVLGAVGSVVSTASARIKPRPCQFEPVVMKVQRWQKKRLAHPVRSFSRAMKRAKGKPATWRLGHHEIHRPRAAFRRGLRRAERVDEGVNVSKEVWARRVRFRIRARSWHEAAPHRVAELIRCHAGVTPGVDADTSLAVASCESGLRWWAVGPSGTYVGIFQHHRGYWPGRAEAYGLPGASWTDPFAQVHVSHGMVGDGGWGPWACA